MGKKVGSAKELDVYVEAYGLAMDIFKVSQGFPKEEIGRAHV